MQADLRAALDAHVHEGFGLACAVLAGLLAFFALSDLIVTPAQFALQVAAFDLAVALVFAFVHVAYRRKLFTPARTHLIATAVCLFLALDILHDTYVLADPQQTTYLMLVVVGAGSIFLSIRWLYVVVAASFSGWILVAGAHPQVDWTTFGFSLFAACVLGVLIHVVRYNTFERLEALRLAEHGRKEQLEIREQALESAVEALQESEERYRRLVEGAPDAMLVIADERILYANPAAARLFGAETPAQLQGIAARELVHPDFAEMIVERSRIVQSGRPTEFTEIRCMRLDGTPVDVEVIGQPITFLGRPADQTVIRDITDRKRAEADRRVASQRLAEISRLKEMDRVKTQFVNTISHELRTPLTPIKVQLHILKGTRDAEQAKKATEVLDRNVGRLSSIVDELLEVARIQAGTLKLAKTYVDLSQNVQQALDSYVDVARQSGIELQMRVEPDLNVVADPKRLQQVMYNLLGNAFKFTEKGGRIAVEVRRDGANALVSVADSGAGLAADDIARLFEPFSQVHDPMEKTNAGTGLGLYICRGIVEGHGGRIWAESEGAGKGARFAFVIPLEAAKGETKAEAKASL
jgi:PAS domain S-box-containing protein